MRALLGHVPDEDDRDLPLLGQPHEPAGHLAHLAHRSRAARERRVVQHLNRVDHAHLGPLGLDRGQHRVEVGLRHDRHAQGGRRRAARRAASPAPRTPRPTRTELPARPRQGCRARRWSGSTCRSRASRRSGPSIRAPGRRPAPGRARRCRCPGARPAAPGPAPAAPVRAAAGPCVPAGPGRRRARLARVSPRPGCSTRRSPGSAHATSGSRARRRSRRRRWLMRAIRQAKARGGRPRPLADLCPKPGRTSRR